MPTYEAPVIKRRAVKARKALYPACPASLNASQGPEPVVGRISDATKKGAGFKPAPFR